jgi:DNA-binding NarL/FixJ family response regulator
VEVSGEAESAPKAIRMINTTHPDVVILDLEIEGGTGIDVLRKVKKGKASPVVIMLTNYSSQPYRKGCFEAGADYFFDKSSELQDMCDVLHNCVADQSDV